MSLRKDFKDGEIILERFPDGGYISVDVAKLKDSEWKKVFKKEMKAEYKAIVKKKGFDVDESD